MKTLSMFFIACSVFWGPSPTKANLMRTLLKRFNASLTDLHDSFGTFTDLLTKAPVEGIGYSAKVMNNIHYTAYEMIHDVYETVIPMYNDTNTEEDLEDLKIELRETEKIVSYTNGLKESMEKAREIFFGLHVRESCSVLPIGPKRVYKSYHTRDIATLVPTKDSLEELIVNIELAVEAGTASIGKIADIIIGLPTMNSRVWGRLEGLAKDLIHRLLVSFNKALQKVKIELIDEELYHELNDVVNEFDGGLILESRKIRTQAEAIKDSVDSIGRFIFR